MWNYDDGQTQLEFIFDDNAGTLPQVMYNKPTGVIAYLTSHPSVGNGMFQYTSQLSIVKISLVDYLDDSNVPLQHAYLWKKRSIVGSLAISCAKLPT